MSDLNVVALTGHLTRDIEVTYTSGGYAIGKFGLACDERRKTSDGKWEDVVSYFDINMFGKRVEALQNYLKKGTAISVSGRLRQDRWEKDGQKRSKVYIVCDDMNFTQGSRSSGAGGSWNKDGDGGKRYASTYPNMGADIDTGGPIDPANNYGSPPDSGTGTVNDGEPDPLIGFKEDIPF